MNSIFKFYNQVWTLLALAGAVLIVRMAVEGMPWLSHGISTLWSADQTIGFAEQTTSTPIADNKNEEPYDSEARTDPNGEEPSEPSDRPSVRWARAGLLISAIVIGVSLFYPVLATRPRLEQRFTTDLGSGTLDALDWMEYGTIRATDGEILSFADDRAAIDWFWRNVDGSPVIVEASIGPYRCNGSRYSIATGLPAVIGWERHLYQQRYPDGISERLQDVSLLYSSTDVETKRIILDRYHVEYIVVGPLERMGIRIEGNNCAPTEIGAGIAAFDGMVGGELEIVFQQGETTIYRVLNQPMASGGREAS